MTCQDVPQLLAYNQLLIVTLFLGSVTVTPLLYVVVAVRVWKCCATVGLEVIPKCQVKEAVRALGVL